MSLPKIRRSKFIEILKARPQENYKTLEKIENILKEQGGIFKMPSPGSSVILLLSGGLDSIVCWAILMKEYKLKVYPLTINNNKKRRLFEKKSIKFFSKFYQKKYPSLYIKPFEIKSLYPKELSFNIKKATTNLHEQTILDNLSNSSKLVTDLSLGSFNVYPLVAKLYAQFLHQTKNIKINTIFCGIVPDDGICVPEQTLMAIRSATWFLRNDSPTNWQFSSVCYEKETGNYLDKKDLIKWGSEHELPLEKTYSCYNGTKIHCGECMSCDYRKISFISAKIKDKTNYLNQKITLKQNIKKLLKKLIIDRI